jgi:putative Ca2+/H+ antiporter (TMEM165/GDT1 family)
MLLWSIFVPVFLAELGDKTQLARLLFAADPQMSRIGGFCASAGAVVLSSVLAVLIGRQLSSVVSPRILKIFAGIGFVILGGWLLFEVRS